MEYRTEDLKRLQETELDIFKEIIRVCDENNLTYFVIAGTALGTIRHNGFIPWDDDIDIGMLRADYDKFIQLAPEKLKTGYTLQHFSTDPNTPAYFAKVRKDHTVFKEKNMRHLDIHHGVFVDIFPFDNVPSDAKAHRAYCFRVKFWQHLYLAKSLWSPAASVTDLFTRCYATLIRSTLHILLLPVSKAFLYKKTDSAKRQYSNENSGIVTESYFEFKVSDLLPVQEHAFETITVSIPNNPDAVLRTQYGDYMKLPPENKRVTHTPVELRLE